MKEKPNEQIYKYEYEYDAHRIRKEGEDQEDGTKQKTNIRIVFANEMYIYYIYRAHVCCVIFWRWNTRMPSIV